MEEDRNQDEGIEIVENDDTIEAKINERRDLLEELEGCNRKLSELEQTRVQLRHRYEAEKAEKDEIISHLTEALLNAENLKRKYLERSGKQCQDSNRRCETERKESDDKDLGQEKTANSSNENSCLAKDARLISLLSIFLNYLPFGADIDYIYSHVHENIDPTLKIQDVENLLKHYPSLFKQGSTYVSSLSKNWHVTVFK